MIAVVIALSGCMPPSTQEDSKMLPGFFSGMNLIQQMDCGGFDVQYYAHPEVSLAELNAPTSVKGFGAVVVPKQGANISKVVTRQKAAPRLGENYKISYRAPNEEARYITGNGLDGHGAPDTAFVQDRPLFNDNGVFPIQILYTNILSENTNGQYGRGDMVIDDQISQVFTADDGSTCTVRPPRVSFRIKG